MSEWVDTTQWGIIQRLHARGAPNAVRSSLKEQ